MLIEMLEENPYLWDIKEIAYSNFSVVFNTEINSFNTKINGLRAQLRCKLEKESKTKSGQSTNELYSSIWVLYSYLSFLRLVMGAAKSKDALKLHAATMGQEKAESKH